MSPMWSASTNCCKLSRDVVDFQLIVKSETIKISRRDFLKIAGVTAAGALLASCEKPQPLVAESILTDHEALSKLYWRDSPFTDVENSLRFRDLEVGEEFECDERKFRTVVCDDPRKLLGDVLGNGEAEKMAAVKASLLLGRYEKTVLFQEEANGIWRDVDLPGSALQIFAASCLSSGEVFNPPGFGEENKIRNFSLLTSAVLDPQTTADYAWYIKDSLLATEGEKGAVELFSSWLVTENANLQPVPDSIPPETLMRLYLTNLHAQETCGRDPAFLYEVAKLAGAGHAVFMPKLSETDEEALTAFTEGFVDLEARPRVFHAVLRDDFRGQHSKILVMHDSRNPRDFYNYDFNFGPVTEQSRGYPKEVVRGQESWRKLNGAEVAELKEFFKIYGTKVAEWLDAEVVEINELKPEEVGYIVVPNKVVGLGRLRIAPGVIYRNPDSGTDTALLFQKKWRDMLNPDQYQMQVMENWLADCSKLKTSYDRGIREVFGLGALSAKEALARYLKGSLDPYDLDLNLAYMPDNPYLLYLWAALGMDAVLFNKTYTETNMAVALKDLPIYRIRGQISKNIGQQVFGLEDELEVERCVYAGGEVNLEAGAFLPIGELMTIKGKSFLVFRINRDDKDGVVMKYLEAWKNSKIVDGITSALAIPLEDALNGVMPLDFDNNLWDVTKKVVKVVTISAAVICWLVNPALAGGLVAVSGIAVQKGLIKVFSYLASRVLK